MIRVVVLLIVWGGNFIFAQFHTFNKETELQQFVERGSKVEETSPNIYKLTYLTGESRVFNFNRNDRLYENLEGVDTTIINMWEIDTAKYSNMFTFWQRVEINNEYFYTPPFVDDLNRNGRPEIYGKHHSTFPPAGPVEIYERNTNGIFIPLYAYSDSGTLSVQAMGEIHGSGEKEIFMRYHNYNNNNNYVVYKSDSIGVLPTIFDFFFYYNYLFQINDMTFGDWDNNGITDCAFISGDSLGVPLIIIGEFRDSLNNFTTVYEKITTVPNSQNVASGFAIGDFDNDGKTELVAGATQGIIYSIEATNENLYELIWQGNFSTYNAYMKASTNDIDGNRKSEFWIGGQDFSQGITRFQCYEAFDDNNYETVAVIELRYINSLSTNYLQAKDIDGDGKEELIISLANVILILKFSGSVNQHQYDIYYVKIGESTEPIAEFQPLTVADLDGDGKTDILLPFQKYENGQNINFSYILKQNGTSGVESLDTKSGSSEDYIKSYPVPFNSTSSIKFAISKEGSVKLKVYNSLGKEIKILLEEKLSPGEYNIHWEARDKYGSPLPSGIYFICLQTKDVLKTIKTILLK